MGWLLGGRFVLLRHRGRVSGAGRQVALEVVEHDRASDTVTVASGFGPRADWYRNVLAEPRVAVQVGRRIPFVRLVLLVRLVPAASPR